MAAIWYLEHINMFELLCPHKMSDYKATHQFKTFNKHDIVYWEQDSASLAYLIAKGKVKIVTVKESGEERIKAILGKGEIFGELALLGEEQRHECAIAAENATSLCPVSTGTLNALTRDYKEFALDIRKLISWKLQKIERRMEILLFKDAETRLREFINDIAQESHQAPLYHGSFTQSGSTIIIRHIFTQQDIADLIGISRPTLNQLLNELRARGIIDFKRKEITINDTSWLGKV
jgi:CRP-like cAMP-binding protein